MYLGSENKDADQLHGCQLFQVFMNLENTAYPLGLLPGSVVIFTRVERKVSRLKNIYARFVAVSSAHVIQISSSAKL